MDMKFLTNVFYVASAWFAGSGFFKLFVYDNGDFSAKASNAYVGGDAYNYIINSGRATAYFVVALIFIVLACTNRIVIQMQENNKIITGENKKEGAVV